MQAASIHVMIFNGAYGENDSEAYYQRSSPVPVGASNIDEQCLIILILTSIFCNIMPADATKKGADIATSTP